MIPYYTLPQIKVAAEKFHHLLRVYLFKATIIYISKLQVKCTCTVEPKGANILVKQPVKVGFCPRSRALGGLCRGTRLNFAPGPPSGLIKH